MKTEAETIAIHLQAGPHWGLDGVHGGGTRAVVMGRHGVVGTANWLASQEGLRILEAGGNAFDAAVAAAAVVSIAEPYMSGIGGAGGAVCYDAASGACQALDFHGFAPAAASPERWRKQEDLIDGASGALVPGVVAGWTALLDHYGTMDLAQVLARAIECAEQGVPVSILCSRQISSSAERLRQGEASARVFLPKGQPLQPGETLVQKQLAETLKAIASEGASAFYEGSIAAAVADFCARSGGLITREDMAAAANAPWSDTAHTRYRAHSVHTLPPPYGSFQVLETLRILEGFDLGALGHHSADHLHTLIESVKLARDDRVRFPVHDAGADYSRLLAEEAVAELRARIDPGRAQVTRGERYSAAGAEEALSSELGAKHTTHLITADRDGNLVSLTQTLGWLFGSCVMAGDTGVLLNDMCYWFDLDPGSPNAIGPRKKMSSPIAPVVALGPGSEPWLTVGTPGGHGILQTTAQMLSNVLDFGMNPQAAVESPRVRVDEGAYVATESRIPQPVIDELGRRGHECHDVGPWMYESRGGRSDIGRGSMAIRDAGSGMLYAGSDPRGDGFALGY